MRVCFTEAGEFGVGVAGHRSPRSASAAASAWQNAICYITGIHARWATFPPGEREVVFGVDGIRADEVVPGWAAGVRALAVLTGAGVSTDSGIPDDGLAEEVIREPIGTAVPRIARQLLAGAREAG